MTKPFSNPILTGFYPDPSVCRVGDDYYLVTSTFEYFPGLPIFHSRDLVHWFQLGHVLDRASQLPLEGVRPSGGLYAPTIRHHQGIFYVLCTLVDGHTQAGNFIVTATNPAGPWSEPIWLENCPGIDPSIFFDEETGRTWFVGNRMAANSQYEGHTEIWLQEFDLSGMCLTGKPTVIWDGAVKGAVWAEGPHLYKIGTYYYLLASEAGTAHHHAVSVARSEAVTGPYLGNRGNPILTHRHLGLDYPIVGTGHADLVDTPTGEWWVILLAMRPYGGYFYNLGRETFLAPVRWEEAWPVISPGTGRVEFTYPSPDLPERNWTTPPARENFDNGHLPPHWIFLRTPPDDYLSFTARPGYLRLKLRPEHLAEPSNPSFVGRRQQHIYFCAKTALDFIPANEHECAGLVILQNPDFHYRFVVTRTTGTVVRLIKRNAGADTLVAEHPLTTSRVYLKIEAHEQDYSFSMATTPGEWCPVAENQDGRILSTPVAGGFVGAVMGMYASSNGTASENIAEFDWFEYVGLDQDAPCPPF